MGGSWQNRPCVKQAPISSALSRACRCRPSSCTKVILRAPIPPALRCHHPASLSIIFVESRVLDQPGAHTKRSPGALLILIPASRCSSSSSRRDESQKQVERGYSQKQQNRAPLSAPQALKMAFVGLGHHRPPPRLAHRRDYRKQRRFAECGSTEGCVLRCACVLSLVLWVIEAAISDFAGTRKSHWQSLVRDKLYILVCVRRC